MCRDHAPGSLEMAILLDQGEEPSLMIASCTRFSHHSSGVFHGDTRFYLVARCGATGHSTAMSC
jgi:hypothetical protein